MPVCILEVILHINNFFPVEQQLVRLVSTYLSQRAIYSGVASRPILSRNADILVLINYENNRFLKKWIITINCQAGYATDNMLRELYVTR